MPISKDSSKKIIIIGSGVFGLSSALHLAQNGYTDITIYDRLDLLKLGYSFINGADTASADINKVFRAFYAEKDYYHRLALQAKEHFLQWDSELRQLDPNDPQAQLYKVRKILDPTGLIRLDSTKENSEAEKHTLASFEKSGLRHTQFDIKVPEDVARAEATGWGHKLNPANIQNNSYLKQLSGVLDSTSGVLHAYNACIYVNQKLRSLGVNFVTGEQGEVTSLITKENDIDTVTGIKTKDGELHYADLVIAAAGPWTATLVPELAGLSEAHSGNVLLIKVPEDRPDLRKKYSFENFPIFAWRGGEVREKDKYGGFGVFPVSEPDGLIKIFCRQKKFANQTPVKKTSADHAAQDEDKVITSVPVTSRSNPPETRLARTLVTQTKDIFKVFFPDLAPLGIYKTQLLWYTDTINNDFIIDWAPGHKSQDKGSNKGKSNLLVVTGGSGHGFKFLPVLGRFVVDVIEGRENEYTRKFQWRDPEDFDRDVNGIKGIKNGLDNYYEQELMTEKDLQFSEEDAKREVVLN